MKRPVPIILVFLLLALQILWFVFPRQGSVMGEAYRSRERIEALRQNTAQPSAATRANVDREFDLIYRHQSNRRLGVFGALLAVDIGLILYLLKSRGLSRKGNAAS
jgi:hypothetical protein